jgi:hypothetical protein
MISHQKPTARRGMFLVEIAGALMVLMIAIGMLGMTVARSASAGREMARRTWAEQEARNAIERLAAVPGDKLDAKTATDAIAPCRDRVQRHLPDGSLTVTLSEPDDAGLTRINLVISWTGAGDQPARPVRLAFWRGAEIGKEVLK